ncbi:uncharacterized protein TOT_040000623 [Theileria orientalis strain Shintoku]|uniref:Phosducin thioredoxin-like domain-containing protein n=1 Tax=Theileria orientalis strain Shintoku TaxID=869250 RepID=J4C9B6_THEOR|nr:uncharacterized protein TOT_040000623 [Theileria orientalis strain Shintoku]PVC52411.1 hypothetical protein MACL_00000800 [Theileria orientalis]BAM42253.1 uncharacterized protein TOT_040000623 [Theileria orientalis strain Shintoku]|eukprot:XP_009692554.1 uncharacterized protein TOT_040000623 [Theileria orientalis strain Shintoku]
MSTTHPTNVTTEWDDIQRKHGNLPKLEKEKTNEELDSAFVEKAEEELLRESRLKQWKKKLAASRAPSYGTPVNITANNFVEQVTSASKLSRADGDSEDEGDSKFADLSEKTGYYVPVLLLDDSKESGLLRRAWSMLARRYPQVKFTVGSATNVLKVEGSRASPPSSILLYFSGNCLLQKNVSSLFKFSSFEVSEGTVEERLAAALESLLNGVQGHLPLIRQRKCASSDSGSDSDSDSESDFLKSSGKDLKNDFLNKLTKPSLSRSENSKAYSSWILDKALN